MTKKKERKVEVFIGGERYVATELAGVITVNKDGRDLGKARWRDDQLLDSTAVLPDNVVEALEKKIKELADRNWDED